MEENTPQPTYASNEYAGFWRRFLAYWIDGLIVMLLSGGVGFSMSFGGGNNFIWAPGVLLGIAYFVFFWVSQNGQTLGNKLLAIKVVREDNQALDVSTGIVRYIGYILSGIVFYLGFLWIIWDKKKQGWHDKIAHTVVVKTQAKPHTALAILLVVIPTILMVLIFVAIGALGILLFNKAKQNPEKFKTEILNNETLKKVIPTLTQSEIELLENNTFSEVNRLRENKKLPKLLLNSNLCAYAQRRLEQLTTFGKFDDNKGFLEDVHNKQIVETYFTGLNEVNNAIYDKVSSLTSAKDISSYWATGPKTSAANYQAYTQGCVRGNGKFMVLITGSPK